MAELVECAALEMRYASKEHQRFESSRLRQVLALSQIIFMNNYQGVIIEESLSDKSVLKEVNIISTEVEKVTADHQTPWLSQWTLDTIEVEKNQASDLAEKLSKALDAEHGWYIDYHNDRYHFVIFKNKVFEIDRRKKSDYEEMIKYGLSVGTPNYQLPNFSDLPVDILDTFLREANLNTYANKNVEKVSSLRPGSSDYHFEKNDLSYHDTYFGTIKFIGAEIIYKNGKPAWGMNYN